MSNTSGPRFTLTVRTSDGRLEFIGVNELEFPVGTVKIDTANRRAVVSVDNTTLTGSVLMVAGRVGYVVLTKADVGLNLVDNTTDLGKPISTATQAALDLKQPLDSDLTSIAALSPSNDDIIQRKAGDWTNRTPAQLKTDLGIVAADVSGLGTAALANTGVGSGNVPVLDGSGLLNPSVLPALAISDTFPVASQAAMLALTAQVGDVAIRSDVNKTFILQASPASTLGNWLEILSPLAAVSSVFGRIGVVTAQSGDYDWSQVTKTVSSLADITTRSASDLSSGTLPDARFPVTLPAASGVNLTALNASNLASGAVPAARMPALTGDVTTTAGAVATAIGTGKVTNSMLAGSIDLAAKVTGTLPIGNGGTGGNSQSTARTALGLGTTDSPTFLDVNLNEQLFISASQGFPTMDVRNAGSGPAATFQGYVAIGSFAANSALSVAGLTDYGSNALAIAGGLAASDFYRNGDNVCVVH